MGNSLTSILFDSASYGAHITHHGQTSKKLDELNVLSFNIFIRPPMVNNNGDDFKDERIEEFLKLSHKYDVVCLQEMFNAFSSRRELFIEKARQLGFHYYAAAPKPSTLSYHFIDAGLLILSRYPIESSEFCPLPPGHGVDYYVQKGILYAKIRIGNAALHVYNSHGQANYDANPMRAFLIRSEQFITFQKFIQSTLSKNNYCNEDLALLMGDYNVDARSTHKYKSEALSNTPGLKELSLLTKSTIFGEYDALLSWLTSNHKDEIQDLLLTDLGEHPITFGESFLTDTEEIRPKETVLTVKHSLCSNQSLDYMFKFVPKDLIKEPSTPDKKQSGVEKLSVVKGSARVEKFLVENHIFEQLSDHYGVQVTVQLTKGTGSESQDSDSTVSNSPTKPDEF